MIINLTEEVILLLACRAQFHEDLSNSSYYVLGLKISKLLKEPLDFYKRYEVLLPCVVIVVILYYWKFSMVILVLLIKLSNTFIKFDFT